MTDDQPLKYEEAYRKLLEWICNSLDMYKYELHAIVFPIFVHCYLELHTKKFSQEAKTFFINHSKEHLRLHAEEIRHLSFIFHPDQIQTNEVCIICIICIMCIMTLIELTNY
jgi:transcription initiation factor TFIID subunit 5